MKKFILEISILAENDLEEIWYYTLNTWSKNQAIIYQADLDKAIEGI